MVASYGGAVVATFGDLRNFLLARRISPLTTTTSFRFCAKAGAIVGAGGRKRLGNCVRLE